MGVVFNYKTKTSNEFRPWNKIYFSDVLYKSDGIDRINKWKSWAKPKIIGDPKIVFYSVEDLAEIAKDFAEDQTNEFYQLIAWENYAYEYRNPIHSEYQNVVWGGIGSESKIYFSQDPFAIESRAVDYLFDHYEQYKEYLPDKKSWNGIRDSMSVKQMVALINGEEWAEKYAQALKVSWTMFMINRFLQLRRIGLEEITLENADINDVIKESVVGSS